MQSFKQFFYEATSFREITPEEILSVDESRSDRCWIAPEIRGSYENSVFYGHGDGYHHMELAGAIFGLGIFPSESSDIRNERNKCLSKLVDEGWARVTYDRWCVLATWVPDNDYPDGQMCIHVESNALTNFQRSVLKQLSRQMYKPIVFRGRLIKV